MKNKTIPYLLTFLIFLTSKVAAQSPIVGHWEGAISIMGGELLIAIDVKLDAESLKATIDIPQQNAIGLPLKNVSFSELKAHFELVAGPGVAVFDGELKGDSINGDFSQAGAKGTFHLKKGIATKVAAPAEPLPPYKEEEVRIHNGDIMLAGTLSLPATTGPYPAVVLITGSGAQNRDEEVMGFKPFKLIADYLTRSGIAVLRCDDRGVGGSTGSMEKATGDDFANDAEAQVKYLLTRSEIDHKKIGLLGHSEGGIIASMVAARLKDIAFIVLMAGPAVTGDKIISKQIEHLMHAGGATDAEIKTELARQEQVYKVVRTNKGWDDLKLELQKDAKESLNKMTIEQRKAVADEDKLINTSVEAKIKGAKSPWFKYFIDFDPAKQLEKVKCPVLALFGELDMQVPLDLNKEPMEKVFKKSGNKDYAIHVFPKANHLFQEAETGNPAEYAALKKEFVAGFMEMILDWVTKRVKK